MEACKLLRVLAIVGLLASLTACVTKAKAPEPPQFGTTRTLRSSPPF
jgi:hypothetical protein